MDFSSPYNGYAPLADTMAAHLYRQTASFHTPGHKGRAAVLKSLESLSADLTELPDTGSLYDGGDAIEEAEILAARAFGADNTFFSAGGCTLCIQAMLAIGVPPGGGCSWRATPTAARFMPPLCWGSTWPGSGRKGRRTAVFNSPLWKMWKVRSPRTSLYEPYM